MKYSLFAATAALLIVSCAKENTPEPVNSLGEIITIKAGTEGQNAESKTLRDESDGSVLWAPDDRISVFWGSGTEGGSEFISQNTENATVADFTGRLDLSGGDSGSNYFWGVYPYDASNECDGECVTLTVPTTQAAIPGTFAPAAFPSMGRSQGLQMGFYNVCAGLRIKVKKEGVKRVIMVSHDGPVAGRAKVAFDGEGRPAVQEIIDGSNTIILEAADGESLIPGENYYFVLYPHKFTDKVFTLTFETDSETGSYVRTKPITFTRSVFEHFKLPVDNNVTYEPLTGIIRTPEQLITFLQSGAASAAAGDKTIIDADIDLSGYQSLPSAASYAGELDGLGHTISGIRSGSPLFSTLSGTVKNIVLDESCSFTPSGDCFGAIAGENSGSIVNVTSSASVKCSPSTIAQSLLVAGIAGRTTGEIRDCINKGPVSVEVAGSSVAVGVAGICAYQEAKISNCVNRGDVTFSVPYISQKSRVVDIDSALPSIGGISAYGGQSGFELERCDNYGEVTYSISSAETNLAASMNRHQIGGVVGSPSGFVSYCNNYGPVNVNIKHSTPGTGLSQEYIADVGGIGGGDAYFTSKTGTVSKTNYYYCTNEGTIIVDSDAAKSNTAIGGIVGWPGQEAATSTTTSNCTNGAKALIVARGVMKCRIGGVHGGSGALESCTNEGTIKVESCNEGSAAGALCAFHTRGHALLNCRASGSVESPIQLTGGIGGLIGNQGNVAAITATGCSVDCDITVTSGYSQEYTGLVVGKFNGNSAGIVLGSESSPIMVSGRINGNEASTSNIYGTANYTEGVHTIYTNLNSVAINLPPELEDETINGTAILSTNNTAGLISDASTGQGIPGVAVSDGYHVVVTDANGVYQMQRDTRCRKIYYSTPSAYEIALDSQNHLPHFFTDGILEPDGRRIRADFELTPLGSLETDFTLLMIGDPQCTNNTEADRYINETIRDIKATASKSQYQNVYAMTLGDIVFDSSSMWGRMKFSMSNVQDNNGRYIPFFQTIGNHDHNSLVNDTSDDASDDYNATLEFVKHFGPTDYSFNRGDVHIISMDNIPVRNVKTTSKPNKLTWEYDAGGFSEEQYNWLLEDLAAVSGKENKMCMICLHIPFRGSGKPYNNQILELMAQFKQAHLMIGHTHYQQNYIYNKHSLDGTPVYEHIHGAACGAWWNSDCNLTGGPNGYTIYTVSGSTIKNWKMKGANKDEDYQLRVYDGNYVFTGTDDFAWYNQDFYTSRASLRVNGFESARNSFVAEVFNDDKDYWAVEFWQNGVKVGDFTRAEDSGIHNVAVCSYWFNELLKSTTSWNKDNSSHYWYYTPASGDPSSEENWEVRAYHTVPYSGVVNTYSCSELTKDYECLKAP